MRILALALLMLLGGCVARTAANIVTFPVRAGSYGVDKLTTSQSEADRNRGRAERKREAHEKKERRREDRRQAGSCSTYGGC